MAYVVDEEKKKKLVEQFTRLCVEPPDYQMEFFLKSFIFALDDKWKEVSRLRGEFAKYLDRGGEGRLDINFVQAADFLQKNGRPRIAQQINDELKDIDLDKNQRISFIEYLLLHFKVMVLKEFYKRLDLEPVEKLSDDIEDGVGLVGVGPKLLDELFAEKSGLPEDLVRAIEEFTAKKRETDKKIKELREKADAGGVKGAAAANELIQMEQADKTQMNKIEISLNAAKRKASKNSADVAFDAKKKKEAAERKKAEEEARQKMAERKKAFEAGGGQGQDNINKGVSGFNKGNLKKAAVNDRSAPKIYKGEE